MCDDVRIKRALPSIPRAIEKTQKREGFLARCFRPSKAADDNGAAAERLWFISEATMGVRLGAGVSLAQPCALPFKISVAIYA
ncbi:hypothetical protein N185_16895 [Sinorhizobium sp. GW3]|nr:hypothetical protein N185_16895 [Sinorhizobium sp. GW3]